MLVWRTVVTLKCYIFRQLLTKDRWTHLYIKSFKMQFNLKTMMQRTERCLSGQEREMEETSLPLTHLCGPDHTNMGEFYHLHKGLLPRPLEEIHSHSWEQVAFWASFKIYPQVPHIFIQCFPCRLPELTLYIVSTITKNLLEIWSQVKTDLVSSFITSLNHSPGSLKNVQVFGRKLELDYVLTSNKCK